MAIGLASPGTTVIHAGSLAEAEVAIQDNSDFGLVIADLMLPDSSGFASLLFFRQMLPQTPIAITSSADRPEVVARASRLGAAAFLAKSAPMRELVDAIGKLLAGEWLLTSNDDWLASDDAAVERLRRLSPAQFKMVLAAACGKLNKQIAYENNLAEATVKAHLAAAFKKLGVTNRVQAGLLVQSLSLNETKIL